MATFAHRLGAFAGVIVALAVAGCETTNTTPARAGAPGATAAGKPAPAPARKPQGTVDLIPVAKVNAIQKGMSAAQVRALLGEPRQISAFPSGGVKSEVWSYRISMVETMDRVSATTEMVPVFDPITNGTKLVPQAVFQNQYTRVYQTLELLMVEGQLTERKPGREVERSFI